MSSRQIITALSEAIADLQMLSETNSMTFDHEYIATEILTHQKRMPDYLHLPIRLITHIFDLTGILINRSRFHRATIVQRRAQLDSWKNSRFRICRNFVRFYESLFLLIALPEIDA